MEDEATSRLTSAFDSPTFGEDTSFNLDKPVGSMSISPCGRDVVLASRQGLHIIDLDSPWAPPRHLPHLTPWEVADVQWSPFAVRDYWVVSTSNQKALVWNLAMSGYQTSIQYVLHAHTRAITDINFSAHHPDILATCAVDSFVHCWDLRHPARPVITFCDWFAGATQVKWNRQDSHVVASSHDRFLRIWDDRKGAYPLCSIEAHDTKIYGLDWNRTSPSHIITCSLDKKIKFWDYSRGTADPEHILRTPFPVWRARHTPFGRGILTMPQRGNNDLHLYKQFQHEVGEQGEPQKPVHRFEGHQDQVKEFLWRPRGTINDGVDGREFQLVSWGVDRVLRLHQVDEQILAKVGYAKGKSVYRNLNITRKNAVYRTFRDDTVKSTNINQNSETTSSRSTKETPSRMRMHGGLSFGMNKASNSESYSRVNGTFMSSKPNKRSGVVERKDIDPIAWMRGVRIGKRETELDQNAASISSQSLGAARNWEVFESLGEEITHVADRFSKVLFNKIDVQKGSVKMSLSGPWGFENSMVYLQCHLLFPLGYPSTAVPKLSIEKSTSLDTAFHTRLVADAQIITHACLSSQRGSLEALVRYLQGEQAVDELIAWTRDDQLSSVLDFVEDEPPGSSDEDDDDSVEGYNRTQTHGTGLDGSGLLGNSITNANVPLPKACGAVWAENGSLICFFPPKEDTTQSIMSSLRLKGTSITAKAQSKLFSGFGRLHSNSPIGKWRIPVLASTDDDDSGSNSWSDESCPSSSSSSDSSTDTDSQHYRLAPPYAWRTKVFNNPQLEYIMDDSQNSSGSISLGRTGTEAPKNIVSIHNLESLLPAKRTLAQQYLISGPTACLHNMKVAEAENDFELAHAWYLMDIILHRGVSVEEQRLKDKDLPILVMIPSNLQASRRDEQAARLVINSREKPTPQPAQTTIKWGQHPLGGTGLIKDLFSYFEKLGDIQMLAMMSCVLSDSNVLQESGRADRALLRQQDGMTTHNIRKNDPLLFLARSRNPYADYYPSCEVASSLLQPSGPRLSFPLDPRKPGAKQLSAASSLGASNSDSLTPFSTGVTPPLSYMPGRRSLERMDSNSKSISTSPEQLRQNHRSNSNLTTAFASFSRPFSFSTSASSSPPSAHPKKRLSPIGSHTGAPTPNTILGGLRRSFSTMEEPKLGYHGQDPALGLTTGISKEPIIKINLKNQDLFHNEGYSRLSLLDPQHASQYIAYRGAYAYLLSVWGMLVTKTDISKYNGKSIGLSDHTTSITDAQDPLILIGKRAIHPSAKVFTRASLAVRRKCISCHKSRTPDSSMDSFRCRRCASNELPLVCVLCDERIRGLAIPCLVCGHVLHSACRLTLVSDITTSGLVDVDNPNVVNLSCETSCGCPCSELSDPVIELPVESTQISSTTSTIREEEEEGTFEEVRRWGGRNGVDGGGGGVWEDVAYKSLAKNLGPAGARFVRPKVSQIWRGLERKESNK